MEKTPLPALGLDILGIVDDDREPPVIFGEMGFRTGGGDFDVSDARVIGDGEEDWNILPSSPANDSLCICFVPFCIGVPSVNEAIGSSITFTAGRLIVLPGGGGNNGAGELVVPRGGEVILTFLAPSFETDGLCLIKVCWRGVDGLLGG